MISAEMSIRPWVWETSGDRFEGAVDEHRGAGRRSPSGPARTAAPASAVSWIGHGVPTVALGRDAPARPVQMDRPYLDLTDKVAVITGGRPRDRPRHRHGVRRARRRRRDRQPQARQLRGCGAEITEKTGPGAPRRHPRRQVGRVRAPRRPRTREFGRCDILVNNAGMSPPYPDVGDHRGVLRQGLGGEPQGTVPPRGSLRLAHGRARRRGDPQHLDGRVDPPVAGRGRLRHGQVRGSTR